MTIRMNSKNNFLWGGASVALMAGASLAALKFAGRLRSFNFRGKTVVITGGSRGLGLALAREFLSRGANVALLARDSEVLERARTMLMNRKPKAEVLTVPCDITKAEEVTEAFSEVRRQLGPIDVLVNNAGLITVGPMEVMSEQDYRESLKLHFWGPFNTVSAVLPEMRERKQGRIVNISSIGGKISVPHLLPYSVGKFALAGFSEGLNAEVAKDGIHVTSVYPGLMRTGSPRNASFKGKHHAEHTWFSLSDSLPGISMSVDRAARQIVNACQHGDSSLIVSVPAKVAIKLHQLFPAISANVLSGVNRLLPGSPGHATKTWKGKQSSTRLSRSWLTVLDELAARKNNEVAV